MLDSTLDRVSGCLLGLAVGDALGGPANGLTPYDVSNKLGDVDGYWDNRYSGLSQAALCVAQFLAGSLKSRVDMASRPELARGLRASLARKSSGSDREWPPDVKRVAGPDPGGGDSASLAAAMAPVGLFGPLSAKFFAATLAAPRRDVAAAMVPAKIISELVLRPSWAKDPGSLYAGSNSLLSVVARFCRRAAEGGGEEDDDPLWLRLQAVQKKLNGNSSVEEAAGVFGNRGPWRESVPFSVFCFMRAPDDAKAIVSAARMGGAASVNAALVGAMCGACAGASVVAGPTRDELENNVKIMALAEMVAARVRLVGEPDEGGTAGGGDGV